MSVIQPTEGFSTELTLVDFKKKQPEKRQYTLRFRLVSDAHIGMSEAQDLAESGIREKYPTWKGAQLKSIHGEGNQETYGTCFEYTATYLKEGEFSDSEDEPIYATLTFSTRGGREKRIHSLGTVGYKAEGETILPDFHHGIGYNNGIFSGIDVTVPHLSFSLDVDLPERLFNTAILQYIHGLTGCTNAQPLWGFAQAELLFRGVSGSTYRKKNALGLYERWWKVGFEFEAQPSFYGRDIPPFKGITKRGWDYIWVFHQEAKDTSSGVTVPRPVAAYVEQAYPLGDFSYFMKFEF